MSGAPAYIVNTPKLLYKTRFPSINWIKYSFKHLDYEDLHTIR